MTRFDQERQHVADYLAQALRESPAFTNKEGWSSSAKVEESATTSGCPLIIFTLDDEQAFNITITRARTPRCVHDWQTDETGAGLVDLCLKCGEERA